MKTFRVHYSSNVFARTEIAFLHKVILKSDDPLVLAKKVQQGDDQKRDTGMPRKTSCPKNIQGDLPFGHRHVCRRHIFKLYDRQVFILDFMKLQYFISTARHLNFTKAAAECHVSQTVISRQIASLEEELGLSLFFRNKQRVELTPVGADFYRDAVYLLQYQKAMVVCHFR